MPILGLLQKDKKREKKGREGRKEGKGRSRERKGSNKKKKRNGLSEISLTGLYEVKLIPPPS